MSEQKEKKYKMIPEPDYDGQNEPDTRAFWVPTETDSKITVPRDLITSDKNLRTKSRTNAPFNLALVNMLDAWDEPGNSMKMGKRWEKDYLTHQISRESLSRQEYVELGSYYLGGVRMEKKDEGDKIKEGVRKGT